MLGWSSTGAQSLLSRARLPIETVRRVDLLVAGTRPTPGSDEIELGSPCGSVWSQDGCMPTCLEAHALTARGMASRNVLFIISVLPWGEEMAVEAWFRLRMLLRGKATYAA